LGENKTFRGFISGIISAIIIVYLQIFVYNQFSFIRDNLPLNYNSINPIIFGALAGFGALFGDSVKSLFKRQIGVSPGKSWFPFDQTDYIIGGIFFTSFYIKLSLIQYVLLFFVWFLIHPLTTLLGYLLKLKSEPL
jgi:CDP-2,3-bis-(O-geranylgeranyl)-sn-glycerol synthase